MRKVELRMNENYEYESTKHLNDTCRNKKAAIKFKWSARTINRLLMNFFTIM